MERCCSDDGFREWITPFVVVLLRCKFSLDIHVLEGNLESSSCVGAEITRAVNEEMVVCQTSPRSSSLSPSWPIWLRM
jgi:hypothetical protein